MNKCDGKCTHLDECVERSTVQALIHELSSPEAATNDTQSHIYMVWFDGEITMTKCNDLLWQRNLHMTYPGIEGADISDMLPEEVRTGKFVFLKEHDDAHKLRGAISRLVAERQPHPWLEAKPD